MIALGKGTFQAVVYPGGLPGAGWDGKSKILMDGKLDGDKATFVPTTGKRNYLDKSPEVFSATSKFPPAGQKDYSGTIADGKLSGKTDDGKAFDLKKTAREVSTIGAKPPKGQSFFSTAAAKTSGMVVESIKRPVS